MPLAQLHWIIADKNEAITVESIKDGIKIYDNPVGVLTNNPPFDKQMFNLNNYMNLSPKSPKNNFSDKLNLNMYSRGMGAIGLPGDFHILGAVEQQKGCCEVTDGKFEYTIYTSCCNGDKGIYYYTAYENHQITGVDMNKENLNSDKLICYPLIQGEQIKIQNQ